MQRLRLMKSGVPVELQILRQKQRLTLTATVTEKPDQGTLSMRGDAAASGQSLAKSLGVEIRDLTADERATLRIDESFPAVVISSVEEGSQAASRFRVGDLIHGINRDAMYSAEEFHEMLGELPADQTAVLILSRNGQRFQVQVLLRPGQG